MQKRHRIVMHCDINAFYPSCEVRRDPSLEGKPLVVGADPKGGHGRGVVTSCSYEARKLGARSGMPISQAYKLAPQAVYVRPDFELYGQTSERVMELLKSYATKFEQTSIDEAFLDVTDNCSSFEEARHLAEKMKEDLRKAEGLTMSIGIAPNKSIAKIASDYQKPDGLTVVFPDQVDGFLSALPVEKISGVGKKTTEFLNAKGVTTIGELRKISAKNLTDWFGRGGVWLWAIANGIEETPVEGRPLRKSISVEQTFEKDLRDKSLVIQALDALTVEVHERLLEERLVFRTVGVKVRLEGFQTFTREKTHTGYVDDKNVIDEYVKLLFREFENDRRKVRLVGVRLSGLRPAEGQQSRLS
ncbi:DNA polymerase IV [Candidatus Bathyarchaeota archaeon]|nr:MAG: DNA polymerase IV [Candidatus Bathyarchaeota archaeon]